MADVERNALQAAVDELADDGCRGDRRADRHVGVRRGRVARRARTLDRFGAVHVLCNNAGVGSRGLPFPSCPLRDFEWVLGVNLWGVIHGLHAFLPHLRLQDEGHIVNTASVSALYHLPSMAPYNASKAAVLALSETLKFELDAEGSQRRRVGAVPELGAHQHLHRVTQPARASRLRADHRADGRRSPSTRTAASSSW